MKFVSANLAFLSPILLIGCKPHKVTPDVSKRDIYEMQERCAESVPRALKYSIDFGEKTTAIRAHYNSSLNRCFIIQRWQPENSLKSLWAISDAQSFAHVDVIPGDRVWKMVTEGESLDAVVPDITSPQAAKPDPNDPLGIRQH